MGFYLHLKCGQEGCGFTVRIGLLVQRGSELARAKKMGIEAFQGLGLQAKGQALKRLMDERGIDASQVVHVGNDINDLPVFEIVGWSVAVADAYPEVLRAADFVLSKPGGSGAVRELCDLILKSIQEKNNGS